MVARVLVEEAEGLLGTGGLSGAVAELVKLAEDPETGSLGARVCAAQALALTGEGEARDKAVKVISEGFGGRGVTVPGCVAAVEAVAGIVGQRGGSGAEASGPAEALREVCARTFPLAEAFGASAAGDASSASPGAAAPSG